MFPKCITALSTTLSKYFLVNRYIIYWLKELRKTYGPKDFVIRKFLIFLLVQAFSALPLSVFSIALSYFSLLFVIHVKLLPHSVWCGWYWKRKSPDLDCFLLVYGYCFWIQKSVVLHHFRNYCELLMAVLDRWKTHAPVQSKGNRERLNFCSKQYKILKAESSIIKHIGQIKYHWCRVRDVKRIFNIR